MSLDELRRQHGRSEGLLERGATLLAVIFVAGCGDVPEIPDAASPDPGAPARCDPLAPFGAPTPLPGFDTVDAEGNARLLPDELTMYFSGHLAGEDADVYFTTRAARDTTFGAEMPIAAEPDVNERDPTVSADGLLLLFAIRRGDDAQRLFARSRATTTGGFTNQTAVAGIAASLPTEHDAQPFLTADGAELWFTSTREGTAGGYDIYKATRRGATFANPMRVLELNSEVNDWMPVLSDDRLTVYLASLRPGSQDYDIWRAHRSTTDDGFSAPTPVSELNSARGDHPNWLSADGCRLYMTSTRAGNQDIFVAERQP